MEKWAKTFSWTGCQRRNQNLFLVICECNLIKRLSPYTSQFGKRQMISSAVENRENGIPPAVLVGVCADQPLQKPVRLNWVKFGLCVVQCPVHPGGCYQKHSPSSQGAMHCRHPSQHFG